MKFRKKRIMLLVLAWALTLICSGCSILPEDSPIILDGESIWATEPSTSKEDKNKEEPPSTEESEEPSTEEEEEPSTAEEEEPDEEWVELPSGGEYDPITDREPDEEEKMQSYLTGEWKDQSIVNRRNIAVMFPNDYRAGGSNTSPLLRQYGLSKASIIYEAPVEGRITALMGLFEDYDALEKVGPVGSSRDYFIYDAMSFDSIYVNWGMARIWVEELINSNRIDNISAPSAGIRNAVEEIFVTDEEMIPDAGKNYTGYLMLENLAEAIEAKEYATEYRESFVQAFLFANDKLATYDGCEDITQIWPGGKGMNGGGYGNFAEYNAHFEYDADKHLYYRHQYGEPMTDSMNGKQLAVTNVVLKICHGEERTPNEPTYDFLAFGIHGTGECYVFTNGKVIKGTWEKASDSDADHLYDQDGNEIVLNQGKTWVCCVWKEYSQYITFE